MKSKPLVFLISLLIGLLSCSVPASHQEVIDVDENKKGESNKFIPILPSDNIVYSISKGLSTKITTGIPTVIGSYEVCISEDSTPLIAESFENDATPVQTVSTAYFQLERQGDTTYSIELLPVQEASSVIIRLAFLPLADKSYTIGLLFITGK